MQRHVLTIELNPLHINDYKQYHSAVWPEVEEALKKAGVWEMETYLLGTRLCAIMQTADDFDPIISLENYADCELVKEWDRIMCKYQIPVKEANSKEWWASMEKVYDSKWYNNEKNNVRKVQKHD